MARYKGKYYSPKRRSVYAKGDDIDHLTLFILHAWTCCVCKEQIEPHRRFPDKLAATVEHLIPLCLGGTHTWDNVAPSHRACNEAKGGLPLSGLDNPLAVC